MPRQHEGQPQPPHQPADKGPTTSRTSGPAIYHIRLRGHLDNRWSAWLDHMAITLERNGNTLLTGPIVDQAALHGVLTRIRDLGLPLISIMEADQPGGPDGITDTGLNKETNP